MKTTLVAVGTSLLLAGAAHAGASIVALTYGDLSGNYVATNATSGVFTARAVDIAGTLRSSGAVSRLEAPLGTADFQPGFVSGADMANFAMDLVVTHNGTTGTGTGTFVATDADGDTITGNISGSWSLVGTYTAFEGVLSNVFIKDNGTLDHTFNGSSAGGWETAFATSAPYNGAVVKLTENVSSFFNTNFSNAATGVTAQIQTILVPLPAGSLAGGATLLGLAGLQGIRRRRLAAN